MSALSQCTEQKYTRKIQLQKMEARTLLGTKERFVLFELKMQCPLNLTYEVKKKKIGCVITDKLKKNPLKNKFRLFLKRFLFNFK